jgi:hypothetical protein
MRRKSRKAVIKKLSVVWIRNVDEDLIHGKAQHGLIETGMFLETHFQEYVAISGDVISDKKNDPKKRISLRAGHKARR